MTVSSRRSTVALGCWIAVLICLQWDWFVAGMKLSARHNYPSAGGAARRVSVGARAGKRQGSENAEGAHASSHVAAGV